MQEVGLPSQTLDSSVSDSELQRLIIFNDSNFLLYGIDGSGKINVYVNGKGVGQLPIGTYVIVELEIGTHEIELEHRDIKMFKSTHKVAIRNDQQFLKIYSTMTSNGADLVDRPEDFAATYDPAYAL